MNRPAPYLTLLRLAAAQLTHEWVLTLCLVAALAAVLAPLLVLLGLKEGTIETLRERLVEDPIYREIRPAAARVHDPAWFERLGADPRVAFLSPTILPASSVIQLGEGGELFDLVPTAAGDPLLLENAGLIPGAGECVLSHQAARQLGVRSGDRVEARIGRSRGGQRELVRTELRVLAVLDERAGGLPRVYASLDLVRDVESYKEGRAVPARGWSGASPRPPLSYRGALVISPRPLDPITRSGLAVNTGLLHIAEVSAASLYQDWGLNLPQGHSGYRLWVPSGSVGADSIQALERKLRGQDALLLPDAGPLSLHIDGVSRPVVGISLDPAAAARLGLPPLPWGRWQEHALEAQRITQILANLATATPLSAAFEGVANLHFPIQARAGGGDDRPWILPAELAGLLRTASEREVGFDPHQGGFVTALPGYRGFRLFARSIDDVPALVSQLADEGISSIAEVESIRRIQILDQGLARLFRLIALLAIIGAAAVLVASLYASVERERRNLGVLRLVGLARHHVFCYPLYQGQIIAALGVLLALLGYQAIASLINHSFHLDLAPQAQICRLPPSYLLSALVLTQLLALLSSLAAAWRATHIEPATAIREE